MNFYFALFDSAIGSCGLAWGARGIAGVQLPEGSRQKTRSRLLRRFPAAQDAIPWGEAKRAVCGMEALLRGEPDDLSDISLDMEHIPPFRRRVYEGARQIPPGETVTYGALAARIGAQGAARAIGQALSRNPFAIIVPCHRVVAAGRRIGGFSAHGGIAVKHRLLAIEGARRESAPLLFESPGLAQRPLRRG
ncbi:MAG: methylated-DNA--[protein]-cysteine S-methyltransferase [Beijerinckiaceae bacterium]|nr:methylated-DNA--[protein]-cysteine S-methyltransferase [Beijerinckiaceae bacterium]